VRLRRWRCCVDQGGFFSPTVSIPTMCGGVGWGLVWVVRVGNGHDRVGLSISIRVGIGRVGLEKLGKVWYV